MSTNIIGAETARWAGLQIDLHSKFRSGNLSADQLEWWLNQSKETRDSLMVGDKSTTKPLLSSEPNKKFSQLADLGIITVPADYVHATRLDSFLTQNRSKFWSVNEDITDANFGNPSRILKPGDRLWVRAFQQVVSGTTTSEERMAFLATQKAVYTGAQGASLVFDQKRDQLPKGKWYSSFDQPDRLWKSADGDHGVPSVFADSDGDFFWSLGDFGRVWRERIAFFCFCDLEAESSGA